MYAVVLAGGRGTRLWPRSRTQNPKHLLNLIRPEVTMLQETVSRILPAVGPESVYVVTNARHAGEVRDQLPRVPAENVLEEPMGRNSGPAVGYAAIHIRKRNPDGVMLVLPADHVVLKPEEFRTAVLSGGEVARQGRLVTLGITPGYPDTGYGYMELGEDIGSVAEHTVRRTVRFTEKPDLQRATQYVESGRYVWNSGMFMWTAATILEEMRVHMPGLYEGLTKLDLAIDAGRESEELQKVWPDLEDRSIDYGVLEKSARVVCLPVDIGWSDVGDWSALSEFTPRDEDGNTISGDVMVFDSHNSLVYSSERLITAIGLRDMIVVDTGDAVLICPKSRAQEVRRVVDRLQEENREAHL